MAKKRKSLMDALSDYQGEHGYGPKAKGAVKGKGPVKDGKTYGKLLKKNKEEDKGGPKGVLAPTVRSTPPKKSTSSSSGGGTSKPKSTSGSSSSSSSTPSKARQQATVTRSNRNKTEAGGMRNTGGRGTPTPPKTRTVTNRRGRAVGTEVVLPKSDKPKKKVNRRGRRVG